jgi:hypothetical protein
MPRARTEELVVKTVAGEVLVYDLTHHRAHSLNATAAALWRACNGTRSQTEIRMWAAAETGHLLDAAVVDYALRQLDRAGLLATPGGVASREGVHLTRRDLIRRGALVGAIPVVASIVAPTAADAQSAVCLGPAEACSSNAQCCSNICTQGICQCLGPQSACTPGACCPGFDCTGGICL